MDNVKSETVREPYEAPVVEDVPLRADEQVLAGCKTAAHSGPSGTFCIFAPCRTQGLS